LIECYQYLKSYTFAINKDRYLLTIPYYEEFEFFVAPTKSYRDMFVENSKGATQSQIRTFIFLINCQNLLAGSQQWDNTQFFHSFLLFCSLPLVFLIITL